MKLRSRRVIGDPLDGPFESEEASTSSSSLSPPRSSSVYRRHLRSATKKTVNKNNNYSRVPELRRAESTALSSTTTSFDDDDDFLKDSPISSESIPEPIKSRNALFTMILIQLECLFTNFNWNGLPWEGIQCRSAKAGLSGVFFAVPILVVQNNRYEQVWWLLQATTSVLADYTYIHTRSTWHGIDRVVAQISVLGLAIRGLFYIQWWAIAMLVTFPVSCFVLAAKAKVECDLQRWHWMHFLWHIMAPLACTLGVYLAYACPQDAVQHEFLKSTCVAQYSGI
jgi:hypothetical protein